MERCPIHQGRSLLTPHFSAFAVFDFHSLSTIVTPSQGTGSAGVFSTLAA